MYRLQLIEDNQWSLLDEQDEEAFRGSLSDCEAWLDLHEQQAALAARKPASTFRLVDWLHRIWSAAAVFPSHFSPAARSTSDSGQRRS